MSLCYVTTNGPRCSKFSAGFYLCWQQTAVLYAFLLLDNVRVGKLLVITFTISMQPVLIDLINGDAPSFASKKEVGESLYSQWCLYHLSADFPRVRMADFRSALKFHTGKFMPAYMAIAAANENALLKEQKMPLKHDIKRLRREKWLPYMGLKLMKTARQVLADKPHDICGLFERDFTTLQAALLVSSITSQVVVTTLECGCCCADVPFEEMVQCADGHLFCFSCLRRSVEESTFGSLPAFGFLPCLDMTGCDKSVPVSEIKRAVQADLFLKFEQRQASDCIAKARLQGLVYCPFCNFPCELDEGISVLKCPDKSCLKESCVRCREPSHLPLRCEEVEKPSDTNHRNQIEEAMTKSILRQCTACKAELIKADGCNKVTCRCGQAICYVCRKAISNYNHFCPHARDPGKKCTVCTQCSLWDQEDSDAVALAAKKAAIETKAKEDQSILACVIGPAETLFLKKRKR
ncbi:hypothetical protein GOP47_0015745 [Adiantum capillus-veneris]|uniref:RING-type domain-containing protein n=1 Tax=Adiantum capillus-veneris TaxID=13818 RepID=A0A9D4ZBX5_ADICA|nr:hypothetical protein GOP47_0015745 [Adiantum capillus-veneris]